MTQQARTQETSSALRSGVRIFFERWRLLLLINTAFIVPLAVFTFAQHKQYHSEMRLLLQTNRTESPISSERGSPPSSLPQITEQQINSELEVLSSQDLLSDLVRSEGGPTDSSSNDQLASARYDAVQQLRKHLTISLAPKTSVIYVTLVGPSPQSTQARLTAFLNAYLGLRQTLSRPAGAAAFYTEAAERYKRAWEEASREVARFQSENHLISVEDQEAALNKQVFGYEDDLRVANTSLAELEARSREIVKVLKATSPRQATQQRVSSNQGPVDQLRILLVQLQNRRTELLTRYSVTNRLVKEIDDEVRQTTEVLGRTLAETPLEQTTDINPIWQQAQTQHAQDSVERAALLSRIAATGSVLSQLRVALIHLQQQAIEFSEMQERADQNRANYELFAAKRDQAVVDRSLDEHRLTNVVVAETPTYDPHPVSPKPLLSLALGLLSAGFITLAVLYITVTAQNTFSTPRQLEEKVAYPVLATFPLADAPTVVPNTDLVD